MYAHAPSPHLLYPLSFILIFACSPSTDAPPSDESTIWERVEVSGLISEDRVWESGKEYYVTGDVTVHAGATLTIEPDGMVKFAHERADDYYGITVEGTLMADEEIEYSRVMRAEDCFESFGHRRCWLHWLSPGGAAA